ncbi:MAG: type I-E CRISPR-associated endonuclease Cas1 [Anaerolineales bacterium]|nr:type I-E CRISPR-associated endonuclease Cas1 [Chloroflexota bacterium]MBL7161466.1 type I-E CRISPR-associated endonuclease Cas1 [Anaerolineales bacterium]
MRDLHELPKLRDSLSYLYVEHATLNQKNQAVEFWREDEGRVMIPVANLSVLLLGPGTSISHAAIKTLADNGCSVLWVGENATRFYAGGTGETRKAYHLLRQSELANDPQTRLAVIRRMYQYRFDEPLDLDLSLQQIRGKEGARVRSSYYRFSQEFGVKWNGRRYDRNQWRNSDPINRALSAANALLNGLCHAAIVSGGYSAAIGFIHTSKQLSFVYDIADLYKAEITIPLAFQIVAESEEKVEARVRAACREKFKEARLLRRVLPDIDELLSIDDDPVPDFGDVDADPALPTPLWEAPAEEEESK